MYLSCLFAAAVYLARSKASHVLPIGAATPHVRRPLLVAGSAIVGVPAFAWCATLVLLETWAISEFAPYAIKNLFCEPRWLPPLSCALPTNLLAGGQSLGLASLGFCLAVGLLIWHTARRTWLIPFSMFALGLLAFGALADVVANTSASARSEILFGGAAVIQLAAAAGLMFSLMVAPSLRFLRLHAVYMIVLALRLLGLVSLMSLWPKFPSAIAVSALVTLMLIPGVAAAAAILSSALLATGRGTAAPQQFAGSHRRTQL